MTGNERANVLLTIGDRRSGLRPRLLAICLLPLASVCAFADEARYAAGDPPTETHMRLVRIAPIDGDPLFETHAGKPCLRTDRESGNPYIYFDVSRKWLKVAGHEPYRIEASIEFFDDGTQPMAVQYDSMGDSVAANFREASWHGGGSHSWRTVVVVLEAAEFRNGQQGRADFRVAAAPGADLRLASISLRVLGASRSFPSRKPLPEPRFPQQDEVVLVIHDPIIRPASPLNEAERIAVERLRTRLADVTHPTRGGSVSVGRRSIVGPSSVRDSRASRRVALVVGRWRPSMAERYPRTAAAIRRLQAEPVAFRRRDGYVVCVERAGARPIVCAVGLSSPGAVYAIGHLHARLMRQGASGKRPGEATAILVLNRRPVLEAPRIDRRELYLNIGYGLGRPGITSEFWTDEEWRRYIDRLVLARYNTWSFYLWADSALIHPIAQANRALNLRLHERLRKAIAYSHRRGLRVGMQFSPSMLPVEIWNEKPAIRAKLEYHYPGTVCPSQPESKALMREVHGAELRWFKDVDFYSIWFYDVGGCFCETCRVPENQLSSLLDQVRTFADLSHAANPRATYQVMAWAIWRYEKRHGYSIRERFVREVADWFRARKRPLEMADGIYVDPETKPLFDLKQKPGGLDGREHGEVPLLVGQPGVGDGAIVEPRRIRLQTILHPLPGIARLDEAAHPGGRRVFTRGAQPFLDAHPVRVTDDPPAVTLLDSLNGKLQPAVEADDLHTIHAEVVSRVHSLGEALASPPGIRRRPASRRDVGDRNTVRQLAVQHGPDPLARRHCRRHAGVTPTGANGAAPAARRDALI